MLSDICTFNQNDDQHRAEKSDKALFNHKISLIPHKNLLYNVW